MARKTNKLVIKIAGMVLLAASGLYSGCAPVEVKLDQKNLQAIVGDLTEEEARQVTGGPIYFNSSDYIPHSMNKGRLEMPPSAYRMMKTYSSR